MLPNSRNIFIIATNTIEQCGEKMPEDFDPKTFVERQVEEIKLVVGNSRALVAISGGVDSSTCAVLTHMAIGDNLICVFLDDGFMRLSEPERVTEILSKPPLNLPVKIEQVQERFLNALAGIRDAEEKRRVFRATFYEVLSEIAKREGCEYLVQGTILADIIETRGGIKTQHNVLEQIGINPRELYGFKVIEPLASLLKWQVREVARYLKIPPEISERQPFPGPGLSVRAVGEVRPDKLMTLKKATAIVEEYLASYKPSQYFAVIMDNRFRSNPNIKKIRDAAATSLGIEPESISVKIFSDKATGIKNNRRVYGNIVAISSLYEETPAPPLSKLLEMQKNIITLNPTITRVLYSVRGLSAKKSYSIAIRAIRTEDFLTASVAEIPWDCLIKCAERILTDCPDVSRVYYDVTPKPPATIEME
ncbi:MAG: ATP-binding protein [Candidatus Bathyarchaeia archaeon]|nr:GMP synthase [Candidatus Bathyarchaeota archaeon]